jgi:hypothetical protein
MDPMTLVVDWMRDHGTNEDVALAEGRNAGHAYPRTPTVIYISIQVLVDDGNLRTKNEEETSKYLLGLLQLAGFPLLASAPARFNEVGRSTHKNSLMWDAYGQRCTEARANLGGARSSVQAVRERISS